MPPAVVATSADADDAVAEQLGVLLGQRDDRHAAHRVADQHDRPVRHGLVEDAQQVVAELLDVRVLLVGAAGPPVGPLVVEDGAHQAAVRRALEVPGVQVQRVPVHEHDRELGVPPPRAGTLAAHGLRVQLVDLDVERHSVVGDDRQRVGAQRAERRRVADPAAGDDPAPLGDPPDGRSGGQAGGARGDPEDATRGAHCWSPS